MTTTSKASSDLGASPVQTLLYVILPLALPGIMAGIVFTFVPLMAAWVEPQMLGGGFVNLLGDSVDAALRELRYPTAAALSTVVDRDAGAPAGASCLRHAPARRSRLDLPGDAPMTPVTLAPSQATIDDQLGSGSARARLAPAQRLARLAGVAMWAGFVVIAADLHPALLAGRDVVQRAAALGHSLSADARRITRAAGGAMRNWEPPFRDER